MSAAIGPNDESHLPVEERFALALSDEWHRVGKPATPQMAKKAGVLLKNFPALERDPHLSPWSAVRVYLRGLGVKPRELNHWHDLWAKANATQERPSSVAERATPKPARKQPTPAPEPVVALNELAVEAATARSVKEYLGLLDELRRANKLSFKDIGRLGGKGMSRTTVHALLTGDRLPTRHQAEVFLKICKVSALESQAWLQARSRLAENLLSGAHLRVVPEPSNAKPSIVRRTEPWPSLPARLKNGAQREEDTAPAPDELPPPPAEAAEQLGFGRQPDPDGTQTVLYSMTAPGGEIRWVYRRINDSKRQRATFTLAELFGAAIVTMIFTGCAVGMWWLHMPDHLIVTVYITVVVVVGAWVLAERTTPFRMKLNARYAARYLEDSYDIFDDPRMVAPPNIGE